MEIWKKISNNYSVSDHGRVRNDRTGLVLSTPINDQGYPVVNITGYKHKKHWKVHRLVADLFLPKVDGKLYVNHKDLNKSNNRVDNLEWCTISENLKHAGRNGKMNRPGLFSFDNPNHKIVINLQTGIFYGSIEEAANTIGMKRTTLNAMLSGQSKNRSPFKYA